MNLSLLLPYLSALSCLALAVAALLRAGRFVDRWAFVAGMTALAGEGTMAGLGAGAVSPDVIARWQQWRLLVISLIPGTWVLFSLTYSRGHTPQNFWPRLLACGGATVALLGLIAASWDGLLLSWRHVGDNEWLFRMGWPALILHAVVLVASVAVLMNLEQTFRASVGTMRWRIKFILLGIGLIFVGRLFTSSQAVLFKSIDPSLELVNAVAVFLGCLLMVRSFYRAGHFDIQVYPSQKVLQGSVTALLAGCYLLIVGVLAKVVSFLGGATSFALNTFLILILLVLLALLIQSDRVRSTIRRTVSRHFKRPLYDYRAVWMQFTEGTAARTDQTGLCRALVRLVADVFQSLSVKIWLVEEARGLITAGSSTTALTDGKVREPEMRAADMAQIIQHFRAHPEPIEFETVPDAWAEILRTWHSSEFPDGGKRVCIPITSRGEVLGLITVGDRVGGVAYDAQDFDMFKCIAEHAAASLLNVHLSQHLLHAKELESFQKMAAFFVHDLKNAASTLNLMLKNLPVHFDDPAFRQDALRGIAKTVARINDLTGRLNTLRHEMKTQPIEADLNELITNATIAVQLGPEVAIVKDLTPLPKFKIDPEQIGKVLINLLLNAGEAMEGRGQLRISSGKADGWVVVTVADTGCGMSADFVSRSLFRPFQTTKKTGLGIGMFQCKAIIDAHGGQITVASEPGNGTVFRVFLPLAA